jgi:uncharacterized iron-regulated membrane protein
MMSVTGVLLTYQKQMTEWSDRANWVAPEADTRAPLTDLLTAAQSYDPDAAVSSLVLYADPEGPVGASLGGGRILYLDPSTARIRGESNPRMRAFFGGVMRVHRWFNLTGDGRAIGKAVTGWSNLVFLFLVISGLYLWFPRRWASRHFKAVLLLNPTARGKARDFNWHHVFGFWTSIPLALIVASATVISFPWASNLAYRVMGDAPPVRVAAPVAEPEEAAIQPSPFDPSVLDVIHAGLPSRVADWRMITLSVPSDVVTPVEARIDQGWGGEPQKRYTVHYEAASGRETSFSGFEDATPGRRFRTFLRFAHTGEYFGVVGQTVAGIVTLLSVFLVWTGFALAWRRLMRPLLRRLSSGPSDEGGSRSTGVPPVKEAAGVAQPAGTSSSSRGDRRTRRAGTAGSARS